MWKQTISTPIGDLHANWTAKGLASLTFADSHASPDTTPSMGPMPETLQDLSEDLEGRIHDYFQTGRLNWPVNGFDWTDVSEFDVEVLRLCMKIPREPPLRMDTWPNAPGVPTRPGLLADAWPETVGRYSFHATVS